MSKIGLGIITCNRPDFFKKCYKSVPQDKVHEIVVVNDGDDIDFNCSTHYIKNEQNIGVGKSKNKALRYLLDKKCDYLFLIEDDIIIKDPNIFNEYVRYIKETGIQHFMYGYHGPANKNGKELTPRVVIDYGNDVEVSLNTHCVGAFCVYSSQLLKDIGVFDEKFLNAWEHVEHSYLAVLKGYLPGYWWWPDISRSHNLLDEQACSEENSAIRPRADWKSNIQTGANYFYEKHKYLPWTVPDTTIDKIMSNLRDIKKLKNI